MIEPWDHTEVYQSLYKTVRQYAYPTQYWGWELYSGFQLDEQKKHEIKQLEDIKEKLKFLRQNLQRANGRKGKEKKEISVSLEYVYSIGEKQNWKCALTDMSLEFRRGGRMFNNMRANSNSCTIDRIDSSLGYAEGNIQLLTWKANCLKAGMHHQEFIEFCYDVVETDKKRNYQFVSDNPNLLNEQKQNIVATVIRNYLNREKKYFNV
jgi:hypothetical protein